MGKKSKPLHPDAPLLHPDHPRPKTRRDFLRQGFIAGTGTVMSSGIMSLFANPREAMALSNDIITDPILPPNCRVGGSVGPVLPVICFDLAGGAAMAGSNVLGGGPGGQLDLLSTAGYSRMGLPPERMPDNAANVNEQLGLLFQSDSQMLSGILDKVDVNTTLPNINGALIAARSDNDTANNPHNPMYAIAEAFKNDMRVSSTGTDGGVISLIGSRNSDSGGNSVAPPRFMNPEWRPA
ncbi:MAG: general secretion pathway protein GspF, partial [Gammaproteobacteria bacterium]|nr:general secretion pathway protein GspF [Gammaproteobacteria bacterium]